MESVPCCDEALTCSRSIILDLQVNGCLCELLAPCLLSIFHLSLSTLHHLLLNVIVCKWSILVTCSSTIKNSCACAVLKGHSHPDTERHEGDQTPPRWLDSAERFTLFHPHCGTLHHNLSAKQRDHSHLGQTHPDHHRAASTMEGE